MKQRARTTQWCWRSYREQKTAHSGVEGLSGPCRGRDLKTRQKTVLRDSATRCCQLPDRGAREHQPRTNDHAVAQCYVVMLEVPAEASAEW